jgi:hypothetical protein
VRQDGLRPKEDTVRGKESQTLRCYELLWSPPPCKPPAVVKSTVATEKALICNIGQEDVADLCTLIPAKHGVDSLRKLRAAALIDAACVNPKVLDLVFGGLCCAKLKLRIARFALAFAFTLEDIFEGNLVVVLSLGV